MTLPFPFPRPATPSSSPDSLSSASRLPASRSLLREDYASLTPRALRASGRPPAAHRHPGRPGEQLDVVSLARIQDLLTVGCSTASELRAPALGSMWVVFEAWVHPTGPT